MQTVVCDLHEGLIPASGHVDVVVDGDRLALDLCADHLLEMRTLLTPAARAAARLAPTRTRSGAYTPRVGTDGRRQPGSRRDRASQREVVRSWARSQGMEIAERGRIPKEVVAAYEAAG